MSSTVTLYYDSDFNQFADPYGYVCYDIHRLLHPWQVFLFKKGHVSKVFYDVSHTKLVFLKFNRYLK